MSILTWTESTIKQSTHPVDIDICHVRYRSIMMLALLIYDVCYDAVALIHVVNQTMMCTLDAGARSVRYATAGC